MSDIQIPVLDLTDFISGDEQTRAAFVNTLGQAYEQIGFASIVNHGMNDDLIARLYQNSQTFFGLPGDIKDKYEIPGLAGQRGFTSFGKEHAKGFDAPDLKEFFQVGQEVEDGDSVAADYPANVQVAEVPDFLPSMMEAYRRFEDAGKAVLSAIAIYLNLAPDHFDSFVHNGNSILRAIYYPPITSEPASAIRAEQHEDINLITLLIGASADGLELLTKENTWMPVKALPGQIVVNVGDMLQRLTNNKMRSTTHRVVNPPREQWHTARYSMPFFLHPKLSTSLACLPECIDEAHPKMYEDYTAAQYLDERLREIGLKA